MTNDATTPAESGFYGLGIAPKLLEALDGLKFKTPTPIQQKAIPVASAGSDMVGIAQTGTGKTIAFAIPMIQRLAAKPGKGLVLVPTRELALQVAEVVSQFAPMMGLKACVIIGGESGSKQFGELRKNPRIIIATPGRLIDHIQQRNVNLSDVSTLVLDEADRMFDMGFAPQLEKIIATLPRDRQTMLFSATMPDEIMKLASRHMKLPMRIEVARPGTAADRVKQELFVVDRGDKLDLLSKLLDKYWGSVLLFVRTKHNAKKIARAIREMPHSAAEIHSNRSLNQRKEALEGFKSGKYRILVATDIAARGIDVTGIELVINYDLPDEDGNYVHRIGRTGRAGQPGHAITFAQPDQGKDVRNIEKLIRMPLTPADIPDLPQGKFGDAAGPRPAGEKRLPGTPQPQGRRQEHRRPQGGSGQPGRGSQPRQQGGRGGQPGRGNQPRQEGGRPPQRGGGPRRDDNRRPHGQYRGEAPAGGNRGGNREMTENYGRAGKTDRIVSPSPYFDEPRRPRREGYGPRRESRPAQPAQPAKPAAGGWFSRFLKKSKSDHKTQE